MSYETIVRPVVMPNIRPSTAQPVPVEDTSNSGVFTIHAASGKFLDLQYSWSASTSQSNPTETKRRYDVARVYQKDDSGNVNQDTFVDIEVANKIWMNDGSVQSRYGYQRVPEDDNIKIRDTNLIKAVK